MERLFYRPKDAAVVLGMSRTAVFRLIKTGELRSVKHEGYRLIPASALLEFAQRLEASGQGTAVA
jgi:excisionase family DNA binding protein